MARDHQNWPFHPFGSSTPTTTATTATTATGNPMNGPPSSSRKKSKALLKRHHQRHHHLRLSGENAATSSANVDRHAESQTNNRRVYNNRSGATTCTTQSHYHSAHLGPDRTELIQNGNSPLSTSTTMGSSCGDFTSANGPSTTSSGRCSTTNSANNDLQFQPADMLSYSQTLGRQYSSSQAQLQSLTSPSFANGGDTFRKTPIGQRACLSQQKQYRSQQSLATRPQPPTPTTIMASELSHPSSSSMTNATQHHHQQQQQQQLASAQSAQLARQQTNNHAQRQFHLLAATHPAATTTAINGNNHISSHPLPPPYSATDATMQQQQLQQQQQAPVNPTHTHQLSSQNMNSQHQHQPPNGVAICQQPLGRPSTPFPSGGCDSNDQQQQAANRPARAASSSTSSSVPAQSANQHVMNYPINQVPPPATNYLPSINNQQYPALVHYPQQRQVDTAASRCLHQQQHQHHNQHTIVGISKSKSCLACADISIKWYIVVIALLGLICALIGTIVGAVHSAGRDYISLALLLIGVGLVFIAISWIALRITINTYKSSRQDRRSPSLRAHQAQAQMGRLFGAASQSSGSLHRALLNERLCMMAAAAAMVQSRQQQAQQSPNEAARQSPGGNGPLPAVLNFIKRRLPRRIGRLLPGGSGSSGLVSAEVSNSQQAHEGQSAAGNGSCDGQTPVSSSSSWTRRPAGAGASATSGQQAAIAALLLQNYQQCQPPLLAPHGLISPFLFAQPPPPPPQLFGLTATGLLGPEYPYRPPPPSYNASMQDLRVRAMMQEQRPNGNIIHWQATNPIYMPGAQQQVPAAGPQQPQVSAPVQQQPTGGQLEDQRTGVASSEENQQCQPTTIVIESQRAKETPTPSGLRRAPSASAVDNESARNAINASLKSSTSTPAIAPGAGDSSASTTVVNIGQTPSSSETHKSQGQQGREQRGLGHVCRVKTLGYL